MATMADAMNNPLLYLGLGLMSGGAERPANQPADMGSILMQALGQYQAAQQQQQQAKLMQEQAGREQMQFDIQNAEALRAREAEKARREAVQKLAADPSIAPESMARQLAQLTGDPKYIEQLMRQSKPEMMNVPRGGVIFDPVTRQPVFTNPMADPQTQQRPLVVTDPGTGLPRISRDQGRTFETPPGFTPKPATQTEPEVIDLGGVAMQTRPLAPKERQSLAGDVVAFQAAGEGLDGLATRAAQLLNHPGLEGITGVRGKFPSIPGGPAFDAEQQLETLKSRVAFSTLAAMRAASKTGGALGSVSNKELELLQNNMATLQKAQSGGQLRSALQSIVDQSQATKDRLQNALQVRYGARQAAPGAPAQGVPATPAAPTQTQTNTGAKVMTQADVQATARASGKSVQEVTAAARRAGYTVR